MSATSTGWLDERPDRCGVVTWLAIAAHRSPFLDAALVTLLRTGRLSDGMEQAVRRARARSLLVGDRSDPERVGKKAKV